MIMATTFAQDTQDNHTAREEKEGKEVWEKLQAKELDCKNLTDDNFEALGEYFMGQMAGDTARHATMNQMMKAMMGEKGEEQMHVVMGKRRSSCNTETEGGGFPMMGYGWNNMMGGWGGFGLGWLFMILVWALVILAVIALVKWIASSGRSDTSKTPLEILKERLARGEIDKKEFEQLKKELV